MKLNSQTKVLIIKNLQKPSMIMSAQIKPIKFDLGSFD